MLRAPNANVGYIEGKVMFRKNRPDKWLERLSAEEREARMNIGMKDAGRIVADDKARSQSLAEKISWKLMETRKAKLEKEDKERARYENWLEDVFENGGLWLDGATTDSNLAKLSKTKGLRVLKAQISTTVNILKCESDKIATSEATLEELKRHLLHLMTIPVPEEISDFMI